MQITKGYKVRLYPNKAQEQEMLKIIGACRYVYNYYLEKRKNHYLENKKILSFAEMSRDLTQLRKNTEWMRQIPIVSLQQSLRCLEAAYGKFFKKQSKFPKFKRKRESMQTFRKTIGWSVRGNKLGICQNIIVRFRGRFPETRDGMLTVSYDPTGKWYASTTAEVKVETPKEYTAPIGFDLGLKDLLISSNGDKYPILKEPSLRKMKQSLSRKKKGSNRYERARLALARRHEQIKNRRINHLHQISHKIVSENQALIVMEDLAVKNMVKNHKLARSISNASWSELVRQIQYKQEWNGGEFIKIDRYFPSSKTCSNCDFIIESLPLSIREWTCPKCGTVLDRDQNAAVNILKQGLRNSQASSAQMVPEKSGRVTGTMKRRRT